MNNYNPVVSLMLKCNNNIKLLTNGRDTKDVVWYVTGYQTKAQKNSYNLSALLADGLMYHSKHSDHIQNVREKNRLLLFRCFQAVNREMEICAPLIMLYLMGLGDTITAHAYVPLHWQALAVELRKLFLE